MAKIQIDKTIYVRDRFKVKRQVFLAGTEVEENEYYAVLAKNAVLNPEDLPTKVGRYTTRSLASKPIETKDLAVTEVLSREVEPELETEAPEVIISSEEKPKRGRRKKSTAE